MEIHSFRTSVWIALGVFVAALAYVPLFLMGNPSHLSPLPIYVFLFFLLAGQGAILVMPILFAIQFLVLLKRKNFFKIHSFFLAVLWGLTPLYFWDSWDYGLRWMGEFHTATVFATHVIGLTMLSGLAWVGFRINSVPFNNALNILSFFFLSWAAFPVLGEMP
jgi:hypothetical protein